MKVKPVLVLPALFLLTTLLPAQSVADQILERYGGAVAVSQLGRFEVTGHFDGTKVAEAFTLRASGKQARLKTPDLREIREGAIGRGHSGLNTRRSSVRPIKNAAVEPPTRLDLDCVTQRVTKNITGTRYNSRSASVRFVAQIYCLSCGLALSSIHGPRNIRSVRLADPRPKPNCRTDLISAPGSEPQGPTRLCSANRRSAPPLCGPADCSRIHPVGSHGLSIMLLRPDSFSSMNGVTSGIDRKELSPGIRSSHEAWSKTSPPRPPLSIVATRGLKPSRRQFTEGA